MRFPFYRDLLRIISWNRSDEYRERRSVLVHIHGVCGLTPPFSVFISYTNPELKADKRLIFTFVRIPKGMQIYTEEKCLCCSHLLCFQHSMLLALVALTRFSGLYNLLIKFSKVIQFRISCWE